MTDPGTLLAVDVGVRTGLALYGGDGRLLWYRSRNLGTAERLRRAAPRILDEAPGLRVLAREGGGPLALIWEREAARRGARVLGVTAETWREALLLPRHRKTGAEAKRQAGALARKVIDRAGAARPTSLRHDAAEAILVGLWAAREVGWLPAFPSAVRR